MTKKSLFIALTLGLFEPATVVAEEGLAGPYLAARHASFARDFQTASTYLQQVIDQDLGNINALETLILSNIALGVFDEIFPISAQVVESGVDSQVAHVALIARSVQSQDFKALIAQLNAQKELVTKLWTVCFWHGHRPVQAMSKRLFQRWMR